MVTYFCVFVFLPRIVIFVKMSDFVGLECALNVMLVCAGLTSMSHGK